MTWLTIPKVVEAYPDLFTERLLYRLVQRREIEHSRAGRRIVLDVPDAIERYLESRRVEPVSSITKPRPQPRSRRTSPSTNVKRLRFGGDASIGDRARQPKQPSTTPAPAADAGATDPSEGAS